MSTIRSPSTRQINPPPRVKSGVIFWRNGVAQLGCDERLFRACGETVFNQRRKMLRVSLSSYSIGRADAGTHPYHRRDDAAPEQLSVAQFVASSILRRPISGRSRKDAEYFVESIEDLPIYLCGNEF